MRIIFVRHGEPDYALDCLTAMGRRQAEAASVRLASEGIEAIYASPCGRAAETAGYTARRLGLPVTTLNFMREIEWGGEGIPCGGHPWTLGDRMLEADFDFAGDDWREHPYFKGNLATRHCDAILPRFDAFLESLGYRHDGRRYWCTAERDQTIALFSHGGSGACALAHMFALPFPYVAAAMPYDFASIIIASLPVAPGAYVHPRLDLFNDIAHLPCPPVEPRPTQDD